MNRHLIERETLVERSKRLGATDIDFTMVPGSHRVSRIVTDACNEIVFEGKILSPAEIEAQKFSEMATAFTTAANRAFEEGRMFK
ncbi:MAG: hypothetical protein PHN60_00770 [Candidatus Gracilibacteria bacterium]|nr:hypothetical protein [Candidatus Gracilibacteria bacterium]